MTNNENQWGGGLHVAATLRKGDHHIAVKEKARAMNLVRPVAGREDR